MILTGKAKEDFIKTKIGNEINLFESMLPIYSNALIVEWFDSVGIYINTPPFYDKFLKYNRGFESIVIEKKFRYNLKIIYKFTHGGR